MHWECKLRAKTLAFQTSAIRHYAVTAKVLRVWSVRCAAKPATDGAKHLQFSRFWGVVFIKFSPSLEIIIDAIVGVIYINM